jgi:FlaA1/EpsC-like NDP-sugar epimerase
MNSGVVNERLKRTLKRYLELVVADAIVVIVSLWLAWSARAVTATLSVEPLFLFTLLSVFIFWLTNFLFRLYHRIWKYASSADVLAIFGSVLTGTAIVTILDLVWPYRRPLPLSVVLFTGFFAMVGFTAVRYRLRVWTGIQWRLRSFWNRRANRERVLIVGAGEAGEILARRFQNEEQQKKYHLVGFIDDDPSKHDMRLHDLPIHGGRFLIPEIVNEFDIDLIVIAIYNITGENFRNVLEICEKTPARIKVIPDLFEFVQDRPGMPAFRDISSEDLLGRKTVEIDESACRSLLEGRRILVTGAAGSIGSELCRQILRYGPKRILLLDNNESGIYELFNELSQSNHPGNDREDLENSYPSTFKALVCSVTNRSKMNQVFDKFHPEIVFHAAAYKHVPMMEEQPDEALWVNVLGTKNLVELSREYGVRTFVFISTDKAVQPVCMMGVTKWLGELMIMNPDAWARRERNETEAERRSKRRLRITTAEQTDTRYTAVRFGNVLSSRGSVVPAFEQQIRSGGPVKVTHPDMTRYFMSITEAVRLVIQSATLTKGQDVFMLDMGDRIKIDDLARRLIRLRGARPGIDIPIIYTGIRPGEKLHEELISPNETSHETRHQCIFRIQKNNRVDPEELAGQIDKLLPLAKEHRNEELGQHLQAFVTRAEDMKHPGRIFSFKSPVAGTKPVIDLDGTQPFRQKKDVQPSHFGAVEEIPAQKKRTNRGPDL